MMLLDHMYVPINHNLYTKETLHITWDRGINQLSMKNSTEKEAEEKENVLS
jgi:hypothetical protein